MNLSHQMAQPRTFLRCLSKQSQNGYKAPVCRAVVSNTAGTYVCNNLLYTLLHTAALEYPGLRGGFLHVPYAIEQLPGKPGDTFGMKLCDIARALTCAVEAIAEHLLER